MIAMGQLSMHLSHLGNYSYVSSVFCLKYCRMCNFEFCWLITSWLFAICRCGQKQSGSFLHVAALNGLFGLGMEKISVPSFLAREGYIADSFSMCFGLDGNGRISFGDKGSFEQEVTPFNLDSSQ